MIKQRDDYSIIPLSSINFAEYLAAPLRESTVNMVRYRTCIGVGLGLLSKVTLMLYSADPKISSLSAKFKVGLIYLIYRS